MKISARVTSLLAFLLISAAFVVAQQTAPSAPQLPPAPIANHIVLVIEGKVLNVHDGDTITVLDQYNEKFHIRLQGIDAPELKQEFGPVSQQNLSRLVLGKQVTIYWAKVDKYRRTVGTIMLDGHDVNIEQVKAGMAWHFKKYEDEQEPQDRITYAAAEQSARAVKLGLWQAAAPMPPGEWRQAVKIKRWGPPPPPGTIIGNSNSKKYHRPDCDGYRNMAEKNRVFFATVAEAEAAGYKRAGNCPAEIAATASVPTKPALTTVPSTATPASTPAANVALENVASTNAPDPTVSPAKMALDNATPGDAGVATTDAAPTDEAIEDEDDDGDTEAAPNAAVVTPTVQPSANPAPNLTVVAQPSNSALAAVVTNGVIIGNKNSMVYHLPGCPSYNKVSEKNQVKFSTIAEAEKAGFKLAGNCKKQ